jgi:hypothetical protein
MRPGIEKAAWLFGVCTVLVIGNPFISVARAAGPGDDAPQCVGVFKASMARPSATPSVQVHHDAQTGATFFFSLTRDGATRMTSKAGDLDVEKTVFPDGRSQIVLQAGNDRVIVTIAVAVVDVQRGSRRLHIDVSHVTDDELLRVKTLLAGSRALRLFRTLAYSLEPATVRAPAGTAMASSDAILGFLDGDVAAVDRLGQRMRAARQARIRTVAFADGEGKDCYAEYEALVVKAADDYDSCRHTFSWWNLPAQAACAGVWSLQAESAWFQFLGCSAVPLRVE